VQPRTRYAQSNGFHIAYQVTGEGSIDVVWAPGTTSHVDLIWGHPKWARFLERFGAFCRLIRFDNRGTGLSDRSCDIPTLEERTDDIRTVMDACGSERAVIFGASEGASMACLFAATYPARTCGLMVWGGQARWIRTDDYPWGPTPAEHERMVETVREEWPSVEYAVGWGAGLGRDLDPAELEAYLRYAQAAASPSAIVALEQMNAQIDVRPILQAIRVPTLVMNRTGDPVAHVEAAKHLAASISGARFVEFPGTTHSIIGLDAERILATIEEFVTGNRVSIGGERCLATLLFVDIVGSTQRAATMGDAAWRDILDRYYASVQRELGVFGGAEVDRAGDGFFARFDGPTRAIRCARSITTVARQLGFEVRSGLHAGEVEVVDGTVRGIAVHIAARIVSCADGGEVLVSHTVKDLIAGSGIGLRDAGVHSLRGVPGEWRLFAVESEGE
jgi:class 3 adenylate cyclase